MAIAKVFTEAVFEALLTPNNQQHIESPTEALITR